MQIEDGNENISNRFTQHLEVIHDNMSNMMTTNLDNTPMKYIILYLY